MFIAFNSFVEFKIFILTLISFEVGLLIIFGKFVFTEFKTNLPTSVKYCLIPETFAVSLEISQDSFEILTGLTFSEKAFVIALSIFSVVCVSEAKASSSDDSTSLLIEAS